MIYCLSYDICMHHWCVETSVLKSRSPKKGQKVPGSKGPRYLKVTFKYKLDSAEGPSCFCYLHTSSDVVGAGLLMAFVGLCYCVLSCWSAWQYHEH